MGLLGLCWLETRHRGIQLARLFVEEIRDSRSKETQCVHLRVPALLL